MSRTGEKASGVFEMPMDSGGGQVVGFEGSRASSFIAVDGERAPISEFQASLFGLLCFLKFRSIFSGLLSSFRRPMLRIPERPREDFRISTPG